MNSSYIFLLLGLFCLSCTTTINTYNSSTLQCSIVGDFSPLCHSRNNLYKVVPIGGRAPYIISWSTEGSVCTIERVSGNTAEINVGFGLTVIKVKVRDANGCITYSENTIACKGIVYENLAKNVNAPR